MSIIILLFETLQFWFYTSELRKYKNHDGTSAKKRFIEISKNDMVIAIILNLNLEFKNKYTS